MSGASETIRIAGSIHLLDLLDRLSQCSDSKEIADVATREFGTLFGNYTVYGLTLSNRETHEWRLLPFANPAAQETRLLSPRQLPSETDLDTICESYGADVSHLMEASPHLQDLLTGEEVAVVVRKGQGPLWLEIERLLPYELDCVLASSWIRPSGGRGVVFLGYRADVAAEEMLGLFTTAVRLTAKLAHSSGHVHLTAKIERISHSLRRNIVHDLKTPVAVIKGYADTLLAPGVGDDPELREEMLTGIAEQAERLLDDLRDILVPLDETWKPQLETFDLAPLIEKAVVAERHTARAALHKIEVIGTDQPCTVRADRRKIRRVIENMLSNAVKYSPGKDKIVTASLQRGQDEICIVFKDQGIGMTPRQLEHVLTSAGRVADTALGIEGTGFGLDSCRRVLDAHGGTLEALSEIGVGTTFIARLPRNSA